MGNCLQRMVSFFGGSTDVSKQFIPVVLKPREHEVGEIVCYVAPDQIKNNKESEIIKNIWSSLDSRYWDPALQGYTNFRNLTIKEFAVIKQWIIENKINGFSLSTEEWHNIYCSASQNGLEQLSSEIHHKFVRNPYDDHDQVYDWDIIENEQNEMNKKIKNDWEIMDTLFCTRKLVHVRRRKISYV